jgi:hypothetical protein
MDLINVSLEDKTMLYTMRALMIPQGHQMKWNEMVYLDKFDQGKADIFLLFMPPLTVIHARQRG